MKRFFLGYALAFSAVWIGYGIYSAFAGFPHAAALLAFGFAFSAVLFLASWFSYWLMGYYKNADQLTEKILGKK
ncbi:hypothetical protein [Caldibacillus debilis]|uniref:DUF485 domain-containing protein n=1 Tax=Caldibacillus debilis GB1 TaxID=1339248 RepID=A0A420VB27_9BACI|nr:hypothetical protein [Caldibacillus debilis]RKO60781.1 hypothetical protein Cdeb_02170 [Caldibacillus debilis GB1]